MLAPSRRAVKSGGNPSSPKETYPYGPLRVASSLAIIGRQIRFRLWCVTQLASGLSDGARVGHAVVAGQSCETIDDALA